jgi:hypothetical protein
VFARRAPKRVTEREAKQQPAAGAAAGTDDSLVPPAWGARLAAAIPGAGLTEYQHEGQMIAVSHRGDVVRDLIA